MRLLIFDIEDMDETKVQVEWRPRSAFSGRVIVIGPPAAVIPVPDDFIVCDWCGEPIEDDPVAVVEGDAVCRRCLDLLQENSRE
jgi:formylmethanofuran dehydrogenase subunit E